MCGRLLFNKSQGLWLDENGDLYVSDFFNHRVQKFSNSLTKTYTTLAPGNYTATVTSTNGGFATSNTIITVVALKTPQVSIASNANIICAGVPVTFTASATYGGNNTLYQWKVNGVNTGGNSNNSSFVTTLKKGDGVSCIITSNADLCLTLKTATSNIITINNAPVEVTAIYHSK